MGCMQSTPVDETTTAPPASTHAEPTPEAEQPGPMPYAVNGHTIEEDGVVYYFVEGEGSFKKRYNDFKALVAALDNPKSVPALPSGGLMSKLRGKHNTALLDEREAQLAVVLNAIANDAELSQTDAFKAFVA